MDINWVKSTSNMQIYELDWGWISSIYELHWIDNLHSAKSWIKYTFMSNSKNPIHEHPTSTSCSMNEIMLRGGEKVHYRLKSTKQMLGDFVFHLFCFYEIRWYDLLPLAWRKYKWHGVMTREAKQLQVRADSWVWIR